MSVRNEEHFMKRKTELMEQCFECMAEYGLSSVGMRTLSKYCGCNVAVFYTYFEGMDDIIVQSTGYCMSKVENEFMEKAPKNVEDLERFINLIPYWTAKKHGKKYRLMYQVYTHPKYIEHGKEFFNGVNRRYTEYAHQLESKLGIPYDIITPLIFILIRACVHYAMFEDEYYLQSQIKVLKQAISMFIERYASGALPEEDTRPML